MNNILALRGVGNSGKSTTIRILYDLLIRTNFKLISSDFVEGKDFSAIFLKDGLKIGITSSGDTYKIVHKKLGELIKCSCDICVCACRTYDRLPPGTNAAILEFSDYYTIFIEKTINYSSLQHNCNARDAAKILARINTLLKL